MAQQDPRPPMLEFDHRLLDLPDPADEIDADVDADEDGEPDEEDDEEKFQSPFALRLKSVADAIDGTDTDPVIREAAVRIAHALAPKDGPSVRDLLTEVVNRLERLVNKLPTDVAPIATALQAIKGDTALIAEGVNETASISDRAVALIGVALDAKGLFGRDSLPGLWFQAAKFASIKDVAGTKAPQFERAMVNARKTIDTDELIRTTTNEDLRAVHAAAPGILHALRGTS